MNGKLTMQIFQGLRRWQIASAVLALIGLGDSIYLWSIKLGAPLVCGIGNCDVVNSSSYAYLFGIPVAIFGVLAYAALLGLAVWALVKANDAPAWLIDVRLLLAFGGVLFSAYLTSIEVFVLRTI